MRNQTWMRKVFNTFTVVLTVYFIRRSGIQHKTQNTKRGQVMSSKHLVSKRKGEFETSSAQHIGLKRTHMTCQ